MQEETGIDRIPRPNPAHPGWIEATLQFVNADEEAIAFFVAECMEIGAVGSLETTGTEDAAGEMDEVCESCGTSRIVLTYFPESLGIEEVLDLLESRARALRGTSGSPDARARVLRCRRIEQEAWATCWKGSFPAERVSGCFWVTPPWEVLSLPEDAIAILLEPGLAFGTGKHATTRHCLEFLEEMAEAKDGFPRSFLDVGCGSGILSIAARRLGATRIMGLDIDPDAIAAARRNLALNHLSSEILLVNGPPECCRDVFGLIAANLDAKTLLKHQGALWSSLTRGGGLAILSGMLAEEAPQVMQSLESLGFRPLAEKTEPEEGWTSVLLQKP